MEPTVEDKAKELGWVPKDQWRGPEEKWTDAETFVTRGEEILPIVRSNNRKLQEDIAGLRNKLSSTESLLKESRESIEELKKFNSEVLQEKLTRQRKELMSQLKDARSEGDVEKEVEIQDQLTEHNEALRKAKETPTTRETPVASEEPPPPKTDPVFEAWKADNSWYGGETKEARRRTTLMNSLALELRQDPANKGVIGKAFLDLVSQEVDSTLGITRRQAASKVEGGGSGGDGSSGGGKSYADLPNDIKVVCDKQGAKLVGKGKAFETEAAWRKYYVESYFKEG